ncbi:peptidase domain-containing ABC transporter [Amycolatopsis umgeniensis]|uniref:ABC-type bacteriocin/lantibiotic exporter with double-glycine peptidase domain n=1 Tax=Amycolatopsis umgeniensis TaxID=336628 RepID=A0A841BB13_9PSEU|nr:peptidase domain-containing ABC transporter [Amycolatopsis umgeniensis]MBB5855704.1 ABC-type bacteriocin/lantibiotic exporter with double-glycine peptidase domain [Amycolatopsis umgeniensis]
MPTNTRFRTEALEHNRSDGNGPVLGDESAARTRRSLTGLFSTLRESAVRWRAGNRIPVCLQTQVSDCGPACLVMMLRQHGVDVGLDSIRARADAGRNGASARTLLEIAREHGVNGRGVRADLDALRRLTPGAILFWNFNHFVVLEGATRDHVDVIDPAFGRRRLSRAAVDEAFTGVALEFDPPLAGAAKAGAGAGTAGERNPWRQLVQFLPRGKELAKLTVATTALMGLEATLPLTTGFLVEKVLPGKATGSLAAVLAGILALGVLFLALQVFRSFMVTRRQAVVEKQLSLGTARHLASLPYDYFTVRNSGDLTMRVRASGAVTQVLSLTAVSAAFDSVLIVVYLTALVFADGTLAVLVVLLIGAQTGLLALTWRRQIHLGQEVLERQAKAQDELVDLLESITTLKASGLESLAVERWSHSLVREVNKRLGARRSLAVTTSLSRTVQFGAPLVVIVAGVWRVLDGQMSLGAALGFMSLTMALFIPLEGVFGAASELAAVKPTLARLNDVLRSEPEPRGLLAGEGVAEPGRISATSVSYRYPGAPALALSDVDIQVEPGRFVVVVGRSGSGKSTLGMLLAGLHLPTSGTITFDGTDLSALDRPTHRRRIGYINQNAHLFNGTIEENILFGSAGTAVEDVRAAIALAHVDAEIESMPMGYQTLVGPSGHGLSGGQRQRIVLARALTRKPRLLIFDEATSALDPALERNILRGLIGTGITVVVIAHRLTVLEDADQVVVLRDGRIVDAGTPAELAERGGEFSCLS